MSLFVGFINKLFTNKRVKINKLKKKKCNLFFKFNNLVIIKNYIINIKYLIFFNKFYLKK